MNKWRRWEGGDFPKVTWLVWAENKLRPSILDLKLLAQVCEGAEGLGEQMSAENVRLCFITQVIAVGLRCLLRIGSSPGYCSYYGEDGPLGSYLCPGKGWGIVILFEGVTWAHRAHCCLFVFSCPGPIVTSTCPLSCGWKPSAFSCLLEVSFCGGGRCWGVGLPHILSVFSSKGLSSAFLSL